MKRLLLALVLALASFPAKALDVGQFVTFLGPDIVIGCTLAEDTYTGVLYVSRYGRAWKPNFVNEVNALGEEGRSCNILLPVEYRVVDRERSKWSGNFEYFCLAQPNSNSCLWVHIVGPVFTF
jgi:hypothetical protein